MNGIEWIVEAHGCAPAALTSLPGMQALFDRIVGDLNLRPVGETHWHQFPQTGGITGLSLLAESHLAVHTFPEYRSLCLNLFCCVPRADYDFASLLRESAEATSITVRQIVRPYIPVEESATHSSPLVVREDPAGSRAG